MLGLRPRAPCPGQEHYDVHAADEKHIQQHDGGDRACGQAADGCLELEKKSHGPKPSQNISCPPSLLVKYILFVKAHKFVFVNIATKTE